MRVRQPNINFDVNKLSQYMQSPSLCHWKAVTQILCCLKGTLYHGLLVKTTHNASNEVSIVSYTDVDWGSDPFD